MDELAIDAPPDTSGARCSATTPKRRPVALESAAVRCDGEKKSAHSNVSNAILANIINTMFLRSVLRQLLNSAVDTTTRVRPGIQSAPIA